MPYMPYPSLRYNRVFTFSSFRKNSAPQKSHKKEKERKTIPGTSRTSKRILFKLKYIEQYQDMAY